MEARVCIALVALAACGGAKHDEANAPQATAAPGLETEGERESDAAELLRLMDRHRRTGKPFVWPPSPDPCAKGVVDYPCIECPAGAHLTHMEESESNNGAGDLTLACVLDDGRRHGPSHTLLGNDTMRVDTFDSGELKESETVALPPLTIEGRPNLESASE